MVTWLKPSGDDYTHVLADGRTIMKPSLKLIKYPYSTERLSISFCNTSHSLTPCDTNFCFFSNRDL